MLIKREVVITYKQTILGPLWFFIQPIMTTLTFLIVFSYIAKLETDGTPPFLFYNAGIIVWGFFSETFLLTSKTFTENSNLFGKVYFPRILVPLSKIVSGLIRFCIQFAFFSGALLYFLFTQAEVHPNGYTVFLPLLLALMAGLSLGCGIIFTSLTTKYRDLTFLIQFGVQLLMYATPVIYSISAVPDKLKIVLFFNPITHVVEGFRYAFTGAGVWSWSGLSYSALFTVILLFCGLLVFNRVEKNFMDTV